MINRSLRIHDYQLQYYIMKELLGKSGNLLQFKLVVFFFYLVYVIMPYVWHLFMQSYMGINRSKKQRFAEMIPFILLVLMVLSYLPE